MRRHTSARASLVDQTAAFEPETPRLLRVIPSREDDEGSRHYRTGTDLACLSTTFGDIPRSGADWHFAWDDRRRALSDARIFADRFVRSKRSKKFLTESNRVPVVRGTRFRKELLDGADCVTKVIGFGIGRR